MKKYSIIVPVYNASKTLSKCIDSILLQNVSHYELILVDDGSKDKSIDIARQYEKENKNIKVITQKNKGAGSARNIGVKIAKGDYLLFLDSDDYVDKDYLKTIDNSLEEGLDLLRFQITDIDGEKVGDNLETKFDPMSGPEAFKIMTKFKYLDSPVCYCYNKKFYDKNKFRFMENTYHEDYALIPLIVMKAEKVKGIDKALYYYVKTEGSTMTTTDYNKTLKKFDDTIKGYIHQIKEIDKTKLDNKDIFKSYIANAVIVKLKELNDKDYKKYLLKLKELRVFDNMLKDTLSRKIKYMLIKINPKIALKLLAKG